MGAVSIDTNKKERTFEQKYALNTKEGVEMLLNDLSALEERRFIQGDYDACNIIMDVLDAIVLSKRAKAITSRLTDRQLQAINLVHIEGYTYEEAASEMGISTVSTVHEHCETGCERIAEIFAKWNYNEIQ